MKRFLAVFFIILLHPNYLFAAHGDEHTRIFSSFVFEVEKGDTREGESKAFDLSGWIGGDYNRLWLKADKKKYGDYEKEFEVQALYGRRIARFWDAQIGITHDFDTEFTHHDVNYLTFGIEGLAPQFFETEAHVFLSEEGNYSARFKQEVDVLLTQRFITQPYFRAEFFAQDVEELEMKVGVSNIELGLMTRYEINRKFAPYFVMRYNTKTFNTAKLAKRLGEKTNNFIAAIGIRFRFGI